MSQKTKLNLLLNKFSKAELKELDQWMLSPLFYRNKQCLEVYQTIRSLNLTNFEALKFHFNDQKSDRFIRTLLHEITTAVELFISYKKTSASVHKTNAVLEFHYEHQNDKLIQEQVTKLETYSTSDDLENYIRYYSLNHYANEPQKESYSPLLSHFLNRFYLIESIKQIINAYLYEQKQEEIAPNSTLEGLYNILEQDQQELKLKTYYTYYLFLKTLDTNHYNQLKDLLLKGKSEFQTYEFIFLCKSIRNICYTFANTSITTTLPFNHEAYFWLNETINYGHLNVNGYLSKTAYYNLTIASLKLEYYQECFSHIHQRFSLLDPKYQDVYLNSCLGYYYFYKKNFKKASYHFMLMGINKDPILLYAQIRLFHSLYHRKEIAILEDKVEYLISKLHTLKLNPIILEHLIQQTEMIHLLIKIHHKMLSNINAFEYIQQHPQLHFKEWYLEQLNCI